MYDAVIDKISLSLAFLCTGCTAWSDASDPLKDQYGDSELVQSQNITKRKWSRVESLNKDSKDAQVGKIEMQLTASLLLS